MKVFRALVLVPVLALANACPVTEHVNAWSWAATGDNLFWMWWWLGHFTIMATLIVWARNPQVTRKRG